MRGRLQFRFRIAMRRRSSSARLVVVRYRIVGIKPDRLGEFLYCGVQCVLVRQGNSQVQMRSGRIWVQLRDLAKQRQSLAGPVQTHQTIPYALSAAVSLYRAAQRWQAPGRRRNIATRWQNQAQIGKGLSIGGCFRWPGEITSLPLRSCRAVRREPRLSAPRRIAGPVNRSLNCFPHPA